MPAGPPTADLLVWGHFCSRRTAAVNSIFQDEPVDTFARDKNFTRAKMKRRLAHIEASLDRYFEQLERVDREETSVAEANAIPLKDKIATLKEEMQRLKDIEVQMLKAPDKQVSLTDPDARSMKTRGNGIVGYNVQTAVEAKHHLIVPMR